MDFKKSNSQGLFSNDKPHDSQEKKKGGLRAFLKNVLDNQIFFNTRLKALEYLEKQGPVTTAMLTLNIAKNSGFLGANYEIKYSLLYSVQSGQVFQTKNFYSTEIPGKEGMIPSYILQVLDEENTIEIKFNKDDLSALYNERNVVIDEESTFADVVELCRNNGGTSVQVTDRVFYTRFVCFNSAGDEIGVIHVGVVNQMPKDIAQRLYPGANVEFSLTLTEL